MKVSFKQLDVRKELFDAVSQRDNIRLNEAISNIDNKEEKDNAIMLPYPNKKSLLDIALLPAVDIMGNSSNSSKTNADVISTLLFALSSDDKRVEFMTQSENKRMSPIHYVAATQRDDRTINSLIDSVEGVQKRNLLSFKNNDGDTPIHYAAVSNNDNFVSKVGFAIRNEVFGIENNNGELPYDIAEKNSQLAMEGRNEKQEKYREADRSSYSLIVNQQAMNRHHAFMDELADEISFDKKILSRSECIKSLTDVKVSSKRKFAEIESGRRSEVAEGRSF